jgi:hypothetical protein
MLVSVVIVNWNTRQDLVRCLCSLAENPPPDPWEAVVVDNASEDGSVEAARTAAPWARVIANAENRGLAAANNQGIEATSGEYVVLSNADVLYPPGAIAELCTAMRRHPRAAIAVPQLIRTGGQRQTSAGSLPTLWETVLGGLAVRRGANPTSGYWWHHWDHDEERTIGHGAEAAYMVRRTAADAAGLQDERFSLDWEGIEWSARIGGAGWEIWFVPAAVVDHVGGASIKQAQARWVVQSNRGMFWYFADRHSRWARPPLALLFAVRAAVKITVIKAGLPIYELAERRKRIRGAAPSGAR